MDWLKSFVGGLILAILLLSLASSFTAYLFLTHSSCSPSSTSLGAPSQSLSSSVSSDANPSPAPPFSPAPLVSSDLVLAPLDNLSLAQGNSGAPPDVVEPSFWGEVHASELRTYEEIIPQTVMGFFNSSQEWKAWALQHLPNSSGWLATGFVAEAQNQVIAVDPSSRSDESPTAVQQGVYEFAASAAGVTLASLDFVSFNGLTALRTLFATHNLLLAACQTLPGQLGQLYQSSFDPNIPQAERADYLGRALAITSVMLLVGKAGGIADDFRTAVGTLGMRDAWPVVKGYLGDIGSKVSAGASSTTLGILQTLAGRSPQDSVWATGLTADQVDTMVNVLKGRGVPNDAIQSDIQKIAQAAGSSPSEDGAAEAADDIEYQQGGWLQMVVNGQATLTIFADASGRTQCITVTWLVDNVPGFDPAKPQFLAITYGNQGETVYNHYSGPGGGSDVVNGGRQWKPTAPADVAPPNNAVRVRLQVLTPALFVEKMPPLEFNGFLLNTRWVTEASSFTGYSLSRSDLTI